MVQKLSVLVLVMLLVAGCSQNGDNTPPPTTKLIRSQLSNTYTLQPVIQNLTEPVFFTQASDGRFFILEQAGRILLFEEGQTGLFLDLTDKTGVTANERGLLGLAFSPDFSEDGLFYVNYTRLDNGNTIVARYQVSSEDPNQADVTSEEIILEIDQPYPNHNGGMIAFGPDEYLYIGMGDGGSGGDPQNNGQNLQTLLGKLLRIDVSTDSSYGIPEDNPFVGNENALPEIWAYGLRNPWRFSFDSDTGDLYIADVGQNTLEEIDFQPADSTGGENYGWNIYEGTLKFRDGDLPSAIFPIAEYGRDAGCSVTGGYVYRGDSLAELDGVYLYGDFCNGTVWWLKQNDSGDWEGNVLIETDLRISSFGQDQSGEVYLVDRRGGIYQLVAE